MGTLLLLSMIVGGLAVAAIVTTVALVLKLAFWLVLLPFRVGFYLLFFPLWLVRSAFKLVGVAIVLPIVLLVAVIGIAVAVLVPLLPVLVVGVLIWAVVRAFRRPAVPAAF